MKNYDHLIHGIECMIPFENFEQELIEFASRTALEDDPYEAMLRETFAIYTIITRRMSRQLYEEEIFVTGAIYDMQTRKYAIPKILTAHLRMLRELRAQYRFLNQYVKNPLPADTPEEEHEHAQSSATVAAKNCGPNTNSPDATANGSGAPGRSAPEEKSKNGQSERKPPLNNGILSKSGTAHEIDRGKTAPPKSSALPFPDPTPPQSSHPELNELLTPGAPAACARSSPPGAEPRSASGPSTPEP